MVWSRHTFMANLGFISDINERLILTTLTPSLCEITWKKQIVWFRKNRFSFTSTYGMRCANVPFLIQLTQSYFRVTFCCWREVSVLWDDFLCVLSTKRKWLPRTTYPDMTLPVRSTWTVRFRCACPAKWAKAGGPFSSSSSSSTNRMVSCTRAEKSFSRSQGRFIIELSNLLSVVNLLTASRPITAWCCAKCRFQTITIAALDAFQWLAHSVLQEQWLLPSEGMLVVNHGVDKCRGTDKVVENRSRSHKFWGAIIEAACKTIRNA